MYQELSRNNPGIGNGLQDEEFFARRPCPQRREAFDNRAMLTQILENLESLKDRLDSLDQLKDRVGMLETSSKQLNAQYQTLNRNFRAMLQNTNTALFDRGRIGDAEDIQIEEKVRSSFLVCMDCIHELELTADFRRIYQKSQRQFSKPRSTAAKA